MGITTRPASPILHCEGGRPPQSATFRGAGEAVRLLCCDLIAISRDVNMPDYADIQSIRNFKPLVKYLRVEYLRL